NLYRWYLDGTTFQSQFDDPTLYGILKNGSVPNYSGDLAIEVPELGEWVYIVIESPIPLPHPIHLHGHDFFVLGQGRGTYNAATSPALNLVNPPRRDVALLPAAGYLVLAFVADNPGVWLMHCHIGWHTSMGFALQIIENLPNIRSTIDDTCMVTNVCDAWKNYAGLDSITGIGNENSTTNGTTSNSNAGTNGRQIMFDSGVDSDNYMRIHSGSSTNGRNEETRAYWRTLHYTSLLSLVILIPIVLVSGEPQHIRRNCYFLDVPFFWFLTLCSGIGSWAVFSTTLLLVKATSPLTATFLGLPRSAFQLVVLGHFRLPIHSWVGPVVGPSASAPPIFVAIDLEAYEFAQHKITEIGISTLDVGHLANIPAGADGSAWLSKIRTRHLLVEEYAKLVNRRYVKGCPDKFDFGISEWISLSSVARTLSDAFRVPSDADSSLHPETSRKYRDVILVGHGVSNDTNYLKSIAFSPYACGTVVATLDTQHLVSTKQNSCGLKRLLHALGIEPEHLHNAGNDAAYTMQAMLLVAIRDWQKPGCFGLGVAPATKAEKLSSKVDKQARKDAKRARRAQQLATKRKEAEGRMTEDERAKGPAREPAMNELPAAEAARPQERANVSQSTSSTNRTLWPLIGGSLALKVGHHAALTYVNLGIGDAVTSFNISLVSGFNQTGNGTFCLPSLAPSVFQALVDAGTIREGVNASLQVIQLSSGGSALYNCADLTFSATAPALPASGCQNSTGVGGVAIANVAANGNGPANAPNTTAAVQTGGAGSDVVAAARVLGPLAAAAVAVAAAAVL
ncbi:hypothetical protein B0A49_12609, partial [Cryomyces minteri]